MNTRESTLVDTVGRYILLLGLIGAMVFLFVNGFNAIAGAIFGMLIIPGTKLLLGINGDDTDYKPGKFQSEKEED